MTTKSRKSRQKRTPAKATEPVLARLGNELGMQILRWGAIVGAAATIVITLSYVLPSMFRLYSSNAAPWEGMAEHRDDLVLKLQPLVTAIANASDAASKAAAAADRASANAQVASMKEDQRDLCGIVDRLSAINMRLVMTPGDPFFLTAKADREREILTLRSRIQSNNQVPEC
jgi:hypothetical protein